jgi:hypothetical protein
VVDDVRDLLRVALEDRDDLLRVLVEDGDRLVVAAGDELARVGRVDVDGEDARRAGAVQSLR